MDTRIKALLQQLTNVLEEKDAELEKLYTELDDRAQECCELTDKIENILAFYREYESEWDYVHHYAEGGLLIGWFVKEEGFKSWYKGHSERISHVSQIWPLDVRSAYMDYMVKYVLEQGTATCDDLLDGTFRMNCINQFAEDMLSRESVEEELECMDLEDQLEYLLK